MNRIRPGIAAAALALLSACTVGPDYVRPTATPIMPTTYKEVQGWKPAQPQDSVLREAWWELFADPQLTALEEQVVISNQNVLAAEARYRQARALIQAARAGYFPTVTVGASAINSRPSGNLGGRTTSPAATTTETLPIDFSWEADLWGRIRRSVEASTASAQASAADLAAARLSAQAGLAQAYFQLRTLDSQRQFLETTVSYYQKSLDLTQNRYASGVVARSDVLQAETQLKSAQAQLLDVGVQRAQLEHAIALLIGKPAAEFSLPFAPLDALPPTIPVGVPSELLERRPDIASAERQMAAANAQIGVARAAWFPTLTLSASGGLQATGLSHWLTWPSRFWSVGPAISETVYDGGLRSAQDEQVRAAFDASVAAYRQTVLTGFQEVEDNLAALRILEEEARVQDETVAAARQTVTITDNQYRAGTVSYLNVLVAQTTEVANELAAIGIRGRRMTASVLLIQALGGGWNAKALTAADPVAAK